MNLTPVTLDEPTADPDDPLESHTAGTRTFVAHHWTWTNFVRSIVGHEIVWSRSLPDGSPAPRVRRRLDPLDTNNGALRWTEGEVTTTLEEVMSATPGEFWRFAPDWRVSACGRLLWVLTGAVRFTSSSGWWTSAALYEVDLETRTVTLIHTPDASRDKELIRVCSVRDDELVVLSRRALRIFRRVEGQWKEGKALRIAHGHDMQLGIVEGRTIALIRTRDAKGGVTGALVVEVGAALQPLGDVLRSTHDIRLRDGRLLVELDTGWHRIDLPVAQGVDPSPPKPKKGSKGARGVHPLHGASIEFREDVAPPPFDPSIVTLVGKPRAFGPDVVGGYLERFQQPKRLVVMRRGEKVIDLDASDLNRFDLAQDGEHVFAIQRIDNGQGILSKGTTRVVVERGARDDAWRPIPIGAAGDWGPSEIAVLDVDHLVVQSDKVLELLVRRSDGWEPCHRVKCAMDSSVIAMPEWNAFVLASKKKVLVYGHQSDELLLICEAARPRASRGPANLWRSAGGELWVDGCRVLLVRKPT